MGLIKPKNNWTPIPNAWLMDKELSAKGLGILVKLQSLPDGWNFSVKGLATIMKDGIDSIRTGVQEVEKLGYLTRLDKKRNEDGTFEGGDWVLHENRQENPSLENRSKDNPTQYNNKTIEELNTHSCGGENPTTSNGVVTVIERKKKGENNWVDGRRLYTTEEEAEKIESCSKGEYPDFYYWPSRKLVGDESKKKHKSNLPVGLYRLEYEKPDSENGGPKVKYQTDYCY